MKTYEITQISEAMITVKVRAENADKANEIALERIQKRLQNFVKHNTNINFGDISEDYLPARDEL